MVVIKTNGQTIQLNTKSANRFVVKAEHRQSLLSEDTLQIALESKYPIEFNIGDKIEHNGRFFTLNFAPKVKLEQGFYQYDLVFEGSQYHLRNKVFFNLDKTGFQTTADFPLTGEIDIFLRTLITNINSLNKGTWILGEFPQNTETKTLTFNGENCLAVLQKICQEYDTEFEITENITAKTYTLNIKKIGEVLDFTFEYGKGNGLYSLTRENVNNDVVTRLYSYGSTENIANDYRNYSDRLRMPQQVGDYIQDDKKVRLFGLKEAVRHFDDIKPTFKGIISRVGAFDEKTKTQEIFVENMDFDLNAKDEKGQTKWLINDTPAKLHFNKGNLAGYDFELIKNGGYNHNTKCFKVKQWTDERGQKFPDIGTIFEFAVGDEFTLIDIVMPDEYITRAENKLWEEAKKEYEKQSKNNVKYSLDIDPLFLKNKFSNGSKIFGIGDYIRIVDRELGVDKTSRIMNISQNLLNPFEYKLDIADDYEINFTISVLNDIKDTKTTIKTQTQINRQNYLNGIRNLAELRDNIFDTEGHFDPIHIKPNSIEANMLTIGAKNQQFALENVTLNPNVNGNPNSLYISGGKLVHFSISENIKEWTLLPIHRNNLANLTYYVYAKVGVNDSFGTWEITTEKIKFNERSGYYYFLCYLLYTPKEGKRDAEAMYGNVMMHGGQISAGRIKSLNGQTYIDLDTGEISGQITFLPNSPALTQVQGMVDNINIGGRNFILNSKNDREVHRWETYPETYIYYDILGGTLEPNTEYTLTWEYMTIGNIKPMMAYFVSNSGEHRYIAGINHSNTWTKKQWTFRTGTNPNQSGIIRFDHKGSINGQNCILKTRFVKLEKGNKPTDWTPAPEDMEAEILLAKTESINASKAYADAQDLLRKTEANAYADGKVTEAEKRAIIDATNKTEAAKLYARAQDDLLKTQLQSYADGIIDAEEQERIRQAQINLQAAKAYADAQDNLAKIAIKSYADGIVTAEESRAIADATAKMEQAKAHALGLVNNLNIGGRNLFLSPKILSGYVVEANTSMPLVEGEEYVVSFDIKGRNNGRLFLNNAIIFSDIPINPNPNEWFRISKVFMFRKNDYVGKEIFPHIYGATDVRNVKLEKGNKPTDWTPAPEDIETSISTAQNTANQAIGLTQAQTANIIALQNKTDFLSNTAINGNGVATGTLIVGNGWGANAGITGLGGNQDVFLWGGTDYSNKNNAPISLHRDGFLRVRNAQGRVIFEIGQQNGDAVFNIYNNNGVKVAGIGQRGIEFLGYIPEDYTQNNFLHIQSSWDNEFAIINEIKGYLVGQKLDEAPDPKTIDNNWVYVKVSISTNTISYYYQAGHNFETANNEQYTGYYQTRNKLGAKTPNGIYAVYTEEYVMKGNVAHHTRPNVPIYNEQTYYTGDFALNVTLYQISDGKIIRQKSLIVNSNLNQVIY